MKQPKAVGVGLMGLGTLTASLVLGAVVGLPHFASAARVSVTCTNSSTDAATINTAITNSSAGDEIVFEGGTCSINTTIKLLGDRTYRGESRTGTVLKQANGANLTAILASDSYLGNWTSGGNPVTVRDLTINGNAANNTGATTHGMIIRSWLTTVENTLETNLSGNGIRLSELASDGTTHFASGQTMVNGRIVNNMTTNTGQSGIANTDLNTGHNVITDWTVADNWIGSAGTTALFLDDAAGWMVTGNHLYGVQNNGIYALRVYGSTISNNYIEDFGRSATAGTYYGIQVTVQDGPGSVIANNRVFNIGENEGNTGSTYRYIGISQVNSGNGSLAVTGNVVRGANTARGTGLYYAKGSASSLAVTSTGNNVTNISTALTNSGATVTAGI